MHLKHARHNQLLNNIYTCRQDTFRKAKVFSETKQSCVVWQNSFFVTEKIFILQIYL